MAVEQVSGSLDFLIYTSAILLIIVTVFVVKLVVDLSNLTKSVDSLTQKVDQELAPTLQEVQKTLVSVNSIIQTIEKQLDGAKHTIEKGVKGISKSSHKVYGVALNAFDVLKHGFCEGVKAFKK